MPDRHEAAGERHLRGIIASRASSTRTFELPNSPSRALVGRDSGGALGIAVEPSLDVLGLGRGALLSSAASSWLRAVSPGKSAEVEL